MHDNGCTGDGTIGVQGPDPFPDSEDVLSGEILVIHVRYDVLHHVGAETVDRPSVDIPVFMGLKHPA